jgi:hypothetical protein
VKNEGNIFRLQCEPRSCDSRADHPARLIEYDDRMRQEEKKYSLLLMELKKSRWLDQSSLHKKDELNSFPKYDVDQPIDEGQSAQLEATRLTGDEILYGGGLTMEQAILKKKKPSALLVDERLDRTSAQHAMMFQSACRDKYESNGRESIPWESVLVESVGLVLQRWRGVCSFSLSAVCGRNEDDIDVTYHLSSKKMSD